MCHIQNDNRKYQETSIHSFKIRSNLISNEGFALARNCLDTSFLSEINFFVCFFLKTNFLAFWHLLYLLGQGMANVNFTTVHALEFTP